MLRPRDLVQCLLTLSLILSTGLVWQGYLLSDLNQLRATGGWLALSLLWLVLVGTIPAMSAPMRRVCLEKTSWLRDWRARLTLARLSIAERILLGVMGVTVLVVVLMNYALIVGAQPSTPDAADQVS